MMSIYAAIALSIGNKAKARSRSGDILVVEKHYSHILSTWTISVVDDMGVRESHNCDNLGKLKDDLLDLGGINSSAIAWLPVEVPFPEDDGVTVYTMPFEEGLRIAREARQQKDRGDDAWRIIADHLKIIDKGLKELYGAIEKANLHQGLDLALVRQEDVLSAINHVGTSVGVCIDLLKTDEQEGNK